MSRTGCAEEEAFDGLRDLGQSHNRKLSAVARQLRDEAVGARGRLLRAREMADSYPVMRRCPTR
jgi:hypothetical protein